MNKRKRAESKQENPQRTKAKTKMFVYMNNKGEFCISAIKLDTRKVDWKFVRRMNVKSVCLGEGYGMTIENGNVTIHP